MLTEKNAERMFAAIDAARAKQEGDPAKLLEAYLKLGFSEERANELVDAWEKRAAYNSDGTLREDCRLDPYGRPDA